MKKLKIISLTSKTFLFIGKMIEIIGKINGINEDIKT